MTRRRWIADEYSDHDAALLGQNALHLARVLRARVGQEYEIVCGGLVRLCTITSVSEERVDFRLGNATTDAIGEGTGSANSGRGDREIVLVMAIYKFDRLEWAIEKCTELGATRIVPVIARRTEKHLAAAAGKRVERWRRIAHEAAQQSRRVSPPRIDDAVNLKSALALDMSSNGTGDQKTANERSASTCLLLNENERKKNLREALAEEAESIAFAVGPEGGWADDELALFDAAGWRSVTLGPRILRAETAAIAALASVAAILD
jgi:16S rRNA (uracil1498-N3)-methyltransferase